MIIKARHIVPADGPVIENGAVTLEGGVITAVGPSHKVSSAQAMDYGDAVYPSSLQ